MIHRGSAGRIILIVAFVCQGIQAQDARLSYHLDPGRRYRLDIDIQQNTTSESVYSEEVSTYSRIGLEFRLDSTDPYGLLHLDVRYSGLLLSMLAPDMGLDLNSGSGKNPALANMIDTLENYSFTLTMDESGDLKSMDGLQQLFDRLGTYPASDSAELEVILGTLAEAYGPNAFQGLFHLFVGYFPVIPAMQNWTRDFTYYFNTKPVGLVNRYALTRTDGDLHTIQGLGMLQSSVAFREDLPFGKVASSVAGSQTYDYHIERESGWLKTCVSRQRVLITTTVIESDRLPVGLEIPSYTETFFDVKGSVQKIE